MEEKDLTMNESELTMNENDLQSTPVVVTREISIGTRKPKEVPQSSVNVTAGSANVTAGSANVTTGSMNGIELGDTQPLKRTQSVEKQNVVMQNTEKTPIKTPVIPSNQAPIRTDFTPDFQSVKGNDNQDGNHINENRTISYGSYTTSMEQARNASQPTMNDLKQQSKLDKQKIKDRKKQDRINKRSAKKSARQSQKGGSAMKRVVAISMSAVLFGSLAGASFLGVNYLMGNNLTKFGKNTSSTATIAQKTSESQIPSLTTAGNNGAQPSNISTVNSASNDMTVQQIAENCMSSVVAITNVGVSQVSTFWGIYETESQSTGSGIIIGQTDNELLIVTNYHVISGCNELTVVFSYDENSDDPDAVEAKVKGYDSDRDLAVIAVEMNKLSDDVKRQISIAVLGDSSEMQLGEQVVAIGNALGYGQSVTVGYISALNRTVSVESENGGTTEHPYIQTDAAINPGNSGGALFNMRGELIGINSLKVASSEIEGMGYAIPISDVEDIISQLMTIEARDLVDAEHRGYLGVKGQSVTNEISSFGIPIGAFVQEVTKNSAAEKAGIQAGDVITSFDGKNINSFETLQDIIQYYSAGESVEVVVMRQAAGGYKEETLTVTLCSANEAGISTQDAPTNYPNQDSNGAYDFGNGNDNDNGNAYPGNGFEDFFGF